uniref:RING-CH-type domain-containing protein n=1 Tax=Panagrolaimus sp. JU765 TaxID=591449 RepID=A0AC34QMX6_9BILA
MVRPCSCAGTMGDIHEKCLNEWVARSRAEKCEICKEPYAKSSKSFKKLSDWSRPDITFRQWIAFLALLCLLYSQINLIKVAWERQFFDRVFINRYRPRGPDVARFLTVIVLFLLSSLVLSILTNGIGGYLARQRIVRFVDSDAHDQEKKLDDASN